jgi:hypothetical protein
LQHIIVSRQVYLLMGFKLKLNVRIGEWRQKVQAKDIGIKKTRKASPVANSQKLRTEQWSMHFL